MSLWRERSRGTRKPVAAPTSLPTRIFVTNRYEFSFRNRFRPPAHVVPLHRCPSPPYCFLFLPVVVSFPFFVFGVLLCPWVRPYWWAVVGGPGMGLVSWSKRSLGLFGRRSRNRQSSSALTSLTRSHLPLFRAHPVFTIPCS